ncbi:GntR family transcriptional regulator [Cochlodiniinecator piscidefendens]|uniref:GntR family transcriptional regulator n=1 Tax=Cochlodiniinecator piscidefendens TaxID=2715756 RepID=UPI001408C3D6|nr:GntR family transcriptional regulator [Cochlodiniinecator piscidefendens]
MSEAANQKKIELYEVLKEAILTLELRPGADIDEAQLSDSSGMSRTPLREVLRQLAGEGYLTLRRNRGARVSEMTHTNMREFFLAAPMIYGAIMQLAAQNALPDQIVALKAVQSEFRKALRSGTAKDRALLNNSFHQITGQMAHNAYLLPSFNRLLIDHARIGMTFYRPNCQDMADNLETAADQHDAIIQCIEEGDEVTAAQLATDHWNLSRGQIENFVMPQGLDIPFGQFGFSTSA